MILISVVLIYST